MSYDVKFKSGNNKTWHIQGKPPIKESEIDNIISISADGHELAYILEKFKNIPCLTFDYVSPHSAPRGYVMTWYGDIAKFIAANL